MNPTPFHHLPSLVPAPKPDEPARDPVTGSQVPPPAPQLVRYWAVSVFSSKTMWFNVGNLILMLSETSDFTSLIPAKYLPVWGVVVAVVNMYLRTQTLRPVALIGPGQTKPVLVPRVDPPSPPAATD